MKAILLIIALLSLEAQAVDFERESYHSNKIYAEYGGKPTPTKKGLEYRSLQFQERMITLLKHLRF